MNVRACRIVKRQHAATAFTGDGSKIAGGRWSPSGVPMVYLSETTALAMLEVLVNTQSKALLANHVYFDVTFSETLVELMDIASLPADWRHSPPPDSLAVIGQLWVQRASSAVLRVPSAIVPHEWNYLLNPEHPDFMKIQIGPMQQIEFDPRLLGAIK
jgi:RES domain-containing protein